MVLKVKRTKYLANLIYEVAERYNFEVVELALMQNHMHMFVTAHPDVSPTMIVQTVKSITARRMFARFPSIKKTLWGGGALWVRGYFVMSSGTGTSGDMICQYIKEQWAVSPANAQLNFLQKN